MKIVQSTTVLKIPDIYSLETQPPKSMSSDNSATVGFVGTFSRGTPNKAYDISGYSDIVMNFGDYDPSYTGAVAAVGLMKQGVSKAKAVRIVGTGAAAATISLMDTEATPVESVKIAAKDVGVFGNGFTSKVESGSIANTFKVTLVGNGSVEVYDNTTLTATDANYLVDLINKQSAFFSATRSAGNTTLALVPVAVQFTGGSDGSAIADADIVGTIDAGTGVRTGLKVLETVDCDIIFAAEVGTTAINTELLAQADSNYRFAVLNAPKGSTLTAVKAITSSLDSDRAALAFPWVTMYDSKSNSNITVASNSYTAGILATLPEEYSPAYSEVKSVTGVEFNLSETEIGDAIDNRILVIGNIKGTVRLRSGITLSKDSAKRQVYRRRMTDKIMNDINDLITFAIAKPNSPKLRDNVYSIVDNYLGVTLKGRIDSYSVVCDNSNNTDLIIQNNKLIVDIAVKLYSSADFIILRVESGESVVISAA